MTAPFDGLALAALMLVLFGWTGWTLWRNSSRSAEPPTCYGSAPGPQQRAENDCGYCPWEARCTPRPFRCKFCGAPSNVDPSDQSPPAGYCHEEDHL